MKLLPTVRFTPVQPAVRYSTAITHSDASVTPGAGRGTSNFPLPTKYSKSAIASRMPT